jgi:hypothetical protein
MDEALTFALSAPFITLAVMLLRRVAPGIDGPVVPPVVLALTATWGGLLTYTGRFTGDAAEFTVAAVMVAAAAMGLHGAVTTYSRSAHPPPGA